VYLSVNRGSNRADDCAPRGSYPYIPLE